MIKKYPNTPLMLEHDMNDYFLHLFKTSLIVTGSL